MKTTATIFLFLSVFVLNAQQFEEVTIPGSQVRKITSSIVEGQEYELHIQLPSGYENSTKKYPVVYLMDSQWDFPLVSAIYGEQYYDGFIPELILVGVTWGKGEILRSRDYTPTNVGGETGGADKFLDFMKEELFPFVEINYRADPEHRSLMGCSLGGLFTLYTLFTHTDMFTGYAAASPALNWDNGIMKTYEENFSKKEISKPVRVYMTVGDVESGRSYYEEFAETMKNHHYKNVRLHSKVLENTGHSGTKSETYSRGLQYIFERNRLKLSDEVLNAYAGTYQMKDGDEVILKNENQGLNLYYSKNRIPLLAHSDTHFYATHMFFNIHFTKNNGEVEGFDVIMYDGTQSVKKIK